MVLFWSRQFFLNISKFIYRLKILNFHSNSEYKKILYLSRIKFLENIEIKLISKFLFYEVIFLEYFYFQ